MNLPKLHSIARVGPRDAPFNPETHFISQPDRSAEEAYADLRERTRRRYATPEAEIRKEIEALRELLPKKKAIDPFAAQAAKQKRERQEPDEPSETTSSGAEAAPSEGVAETMESVPLPRPAPVEPAALRRPSRPPPRNRRWLISRTVLERGSRRSCASATPPSAVAASKNSSDTGLSPARKPTSANSPFAGSRPWCPTSARLPRSQKLQASAEKLLPSRS